MLLVCENELAQAGSQWTWTWLHVDACMSELAKLVRTEVLPLRVQLQQYICIMGHPATLI